MNSYLADSIAATSPPGVHQPDIGVVFLDFVRQQVCVYLRLEGHEGLPETGGERGDGFLDSDFGSSDLGSVA